MTAPKSPKECHWGSATTTGTIYQVKFSFIGKANIRGGGGGGGGENYLCTCSKKKMKTMLLRKKLKWCHTEYEICLKTFCITNCEECWYKYVKNHRKVVSDLPGKIVPFPPPVITLTSKCHNFFSIGSLSSLEMYVRQKFSLCLFS